MNKFMLIALLIFTISIKSNCQNQDSITAKQVLQNYIMAIGGMEKVKEVVSIETTGRQMINGIEHTLKEKTQKNVSFFLERTFEGKTMASILNDGLGVNITPEGIFSMPPDQVYRYQNDMIIIPELEYLEEEYQVEYNGMLDLEEGVKCHELSIELPDGSKIFNEYNIETGLLEMSINKSIRTRILEYREFEGVKIPSNYIQNRTRYILDKAIINPEFDETVFEWNSDMEGWFVGRWEASVISTDESERINFIELDKNRGGKDGVEVLANDIPKEAGFLTSTIVGWEIDGENVKLNYYNPQSKKLFTKYWVILEREGETIRGYISDPELDERFGSEVKPIILTYKKK